MDSLITADPLVQVCIRVPQSHVDLMKANGENISELSRTGIKARVDYYLAGGVSAIRDKIKECESIKDDMDLQISIYEHQIQQILQTTAEAVSKQQEEEAKYNKFISEIQRLAPAIIENHDGTARYKIEHLAGLSPGPGRADIARFFQGRRELPEVGEIREFLKIE